MKTITSIKDEKITLARALKSRKGRQEHARILLEGEEILDWALEHRLHLEFVFLCDKLLSPTVEKYRSQNLEIFSVSEGLAKKITDTSYVVPIIAVARQPANHESGPADFIVVLDGVQDFGNIGTIIRTCQAFGIRDIIATTNDFDLYQRKTIEASRGSVFASHTVNFTDAAQTIAYLKKHNYQIVATTPYGAELQSLVELKHQPVALIVGNETAGINPEFAHQADLLIQIPMFHTVESLNVGVATGISIYELRLKQALAMIEERIKATLGRELNVAGFMVQQALDAELSRVSSLSSRQVIFMMVLKCDLIMHQEDLCRQFGVLERDVDAFMAPLLNSCLVRLEDGEMQLTGKGEETLAKLWPTVENTEAKILSTLTTTEIRLLFHQLQGIQERCVQIRDSYPDNIKHVE
jgi:RNA methyltransferase, TrmH family